MVFLYRYIKGFEISRSKLAEKVGIENVDSMIEFILYENLDWDHFKYLACGNRPDHEITRPMVIVLDDDNDLEALKARPLGEVNQSILRMKSVLDGPDVWERAV